MSTDAEAGCTNSGALLLESFLLGETVVPLSLFGEVVSSMAEATATSVRLDRSSLPLATYSIPTEPNPMRSGPASGKRSLSRTVDLSLPVEFKKIV